MKHILDSDFRYRPSFDTDVRKTWILFGDPTVRLK